MQILLSVLLTVLAGASLVAGQTAISNSTPPGVLHRRQFFYIGGEYVATPNGTNGTQSAHGQMYVEHLVPAQVIQPTPLIFIHGLYMTGTNFLNTPDGRLGWADHFMSLGYELYIIDQPARARSPLLNGVDGSLLLPDNISVQLRFTATQFYNAWPQASLHTQWPGNGSFGDPVFEQFFKATVEALADNTVSGQLITSAASLLLDAIGKPVIILTHSQAGAYGWSIADARPDLVRGIIAIEPSGPPFINAIFAPITPGRVYGVSDVPLTYDPPISDPSELQPTTVSSNPSLNYTCMRQGGNPPRRLVNLANIPVLVVTSPSGYHTVYDNCTVDYLRQAGVTVQHVELAGVGIMGNGHMMFMEKNNIEIATQVLEPWLNQTLSGSSS